MANLGPSPDPHDFRRLVEELRHSDLLGAAGGTVDVRETHASVVFLTQTEAYKLKKPVNLGFLDYSSRRRRALMARREVNLNRRLAPSVYLGVERLVRRADGSLAFGHAGPALDYLVHMRRLADSESLAARLHTGLVTVSDIRRVADRIAAFHASAAVAPARYGRRAHLQRNTAENLDAIACGSGTWLSRPVVDELDRRMRDFLAISEPLFAARIAAGLIRDGHGDLRCEHVYLSGDAIHIIDCIEFASRFRKGDVGLDLAFLAMDLATSGAPDLAKALVEQYARATHNDLGGLLPFYMAYRATVRCKVALVRATEMEFEASQRESASREALRYLYAALRFIRMDETPWLIAVGGLTGTGKSTTAQLLASVLPAEIVSADETRKRLAGLGPNQHRYDAPGEGIYSPETTARVYAALGARAEAALAAGRWLILDATFRRRADRDAVRAVAARYAARFLFVQCTAPDEIVRARLDARTAAGGDPWSDGRLEVYLGQRAGYERVDGDETPTAIALDTELAPYEQANRIIADLAGEDSVDRHDHS